MQGALRNNTLTPTRQCVYISGLLIRAHVTTQRYKLSTRLLLNVFSHPIGGYGYHVHTHGVTRRVREPDEHVCTHNKALGALESPMLSCRCSNPLKLLEVVLHPLAKPHTFINRPSPEHWCTRHPIPNHPSLDSTAQIGGLRTPVSRGNQRPLCCCKWEEYLSLPERVVHKQGTHNADR